MNIRPIDRLKQAMGETGQGMGIGVLAGSVAGLLLGLTAPFNGRRRPRRAVLAYGIGAVTGGTIGTLIWKQLGRSATELPPLDLATLPGHWTLFQEQVAEIPETTEIQVATKRVREVEEVVLHPVEAEHLTTVEDIVRHTEVEIEQAQGAKGLELETGKASKWKTGG